jgi:cell division protein FtsW (lipid II flippase)
MTNIYPSNWLIGFLSYSIMAAIVTFVLMVILSPYRMERISAQIQPWDGFEVIDCGNITGSRPALSCGILRLEQENSR